MKPLSKLTIGLGIYIIISASFMLQVRNFLVRTTGEDAVRLMFFILFSLLVGLYILYISYRRLSVYKLGLTLLGFGLAYLLILWQPFFAEKIHVLEYGVLGFLALKDLNKADKRIFKNIMYALLFVGLIGLLDEAFQWVLPYRVGEMRDVMTNVMSGSLGVIQYLVYSNRVI